MDNINDQQDEVKFEVEKLRAECRARSKLSDSLTKAHDEQLGKTQQEKSEIDKLAKELRAKFEEICEIRQLYKELQSSLHRKDLFLQQISSASEKLQAEHTGKILKLESENRDLVLSLDEALARIQDLEKKTCESSEEIGCLKRLLLIKQEKNSEVQKNASKDLKEREEYIFKLEEESKVTEDQIEWKSEQSSYLEEAYKKLLDKFQVSKSEWQKEKSLLFNEISSLQATLDAQIRVSETLETQLRMSNQALAHEQSRRKVLELEVSESRSRCENVFLECQVENSEIERLTLKRDEEIAELRILLRKKEILANDMNYKIKLLEQENSDQKVSLKEMREAQSQLKNNAALKRLQNKLQGLEQLHSKCVVNLKEKEVNMNSQIEKLTVDIHHCLSAMAVKNISLRELHMELEDCQCVLEVKSKEIFALVMVLISDFYVAHSKLYDAKEKLEMGMMQTKEKNLFLDQQLQLKNTELHKVYDELKQRSDEVTSVMEQVECLESLKLKDNFIEVELRWKKAMLDESNECRNRLEMQLPELENTHKDNIENALDKLNSELSNKTSESEKCKLELKKSQSKVGILKSNLEENQQAHEQEITNLHVMMNDKDAKFGKLQEKISVLESEILAKLEAAEMLNQEKDNYIRIAEDRNCSIKSLQNEIAQIKNNLVERDAANTALLVAHNTLGEENERLLSSAKERDQKFQELQKEHESLNQELESMIFLAEKAVVLDEALQTAEYQKMLQIEEKNQAIANLEIKVNGLREKVETQEKSLLHSRQKILHVEETKKSEMLVLRTQLEEQKRCFEGLLEELESHKRSLLEERRKANIERENLLAQIEGMYGQIGVLSREDVELMGMLETMSHLSEEDSDAVRSLSSDGLNCTTFSPSIKFQVSVEGRTPLMQLNR